MKVSQRGFNLIELMLGLTIAGVLLSVGMPALRDMTLRQRMVTSSQDLRMDMMFARQEAITRGSTATVCPTTDNVSCDGGTDWALGRIVFADVNGNGAFDAGDTVVRQSPALQAAMTATSTRSFATFDALGGHPAGGFMVSICRADMTQMNVRVRRAGQSSADKTTTVCP